MKSKLLTTRFINHKALITLFTSLAISFSILAVQPNESLKIITDKSRVTGELRVYLQNIGSTDVKVATSNLGMLRSENSYELSPTRHSLISGGKKFELKESLNDYSVVLLKPGEITYLKGFTITADKGVIDYYVKPSWAKMHDLWGGRLSTSF